MSVTFDWFTKQDRYGDRVFRAWVNAVLIAFGVAAAVVALVVGITRISRAADAASCRTYASQSGYPTRFRINHFLSPGTCFVRLPNGHWLPEKRVTGFIKAEK